MRSTQIFPTLVMGLALLSSACDPDAPTQSAVDGLDPLVAHSPTHHGITAVEISPAALPAYTELVGAAAVGHRGAITLSVQTGGEIPRFPDGFILSVAVFGYAWVDASTGTGVVSVIHPAIGRDSNQNPDGWHTHPVQLTAPGSYDFCIVHIGTSQGGISIRDRSVDVHVALRQAGLSADVLDVAAAFVVRPDGACVSGLGVQVLSARAL